MRGNPDNLKPWPKGMSGNPGGRPNKRAITEELERLLAQQVPDKDCETWASTIALAMLTEARKGNVQAFNAIRDMVEGKPVPRFGGIGSDGAAQHRIVVRFVDSAQGDRKGDAYARQPHKPVR